MDEERHHPQCHLPAPVQSSGHQRRNPVSFATRQSRSRTTLCTPLRPCGRLLILGIFLLAILLEPALSQNPQIRLDPSLTLVQDETTTATITLENTTVQLLNSGVVLSSFPSDLTTSLTITLVSPPDWDREGLLYDSGISEPASTNRSPTDGTLVLNFTNLSDLQFTDTLRGLRYHHTLLAPSNTESRNVTIRATTAHNVSNTITVVVSWDASYAAFPQVALSATARLGERTSVSFTEGSTSLTYLSPSVRLDYPITETFTELNLTLNAILADGSDYDLAGDGDRIFPFITTIPLVQTELVGSTLVVTPLLPGGSLNLREWRDEVLVQLVYTNVDAEPKYRSSHLEAGGADLIIHRWVTYSVKTSRHGSDVINIGSVNITLATINDSPPALCAQCLSDDGSDTPCVSSTGGLTGRRRRRRSSSEPTFDESLLTNGLDLLSELDRHRPLEATPTVNLSEIVTHDDQLLHVHIEFSSDTNRPQLNPLGSHTLHLDGDSVHQGDLTAVWRDPRNLYLVPRISQRKASVPVHTPLRLCFRFGSSHHHADDNVRRVCRTAVCHASGWSRPVPSDKWCARHTHLRTGTRLYVIPGQHDNHHAHSQASLGVASLCFMTLAFMFLLLFKQRKGKSPPKSLSSRRSKAKSRRWKLAKHRSSAEGKLPSNRCPVAEPIKSDNRDRTAIFGKEVTVHIPSPSNLTGNSLPLKTRRVGSIEEMATEQLD
eukprot:scpid28225/ scgid26535/ 